MARKSMGLNAAVLHATSTSVPVVVVKKLERTKLSVANLGTEPDHRALATAIEQGKRKAFEYRVRLAKRARKYARKLRPELIRAISTTTYKTVTFTVPEKLFAEHDERAFLATELLVRWLRRSGIDAGRTGRTISIKLEQKVNEEKTHD